MPSHAGAAAKSIFSVAGSRKAPFIGEPFIWDSAAGGTSTKGRLWTSKLTAVKLRRTVGFFGAGVEEGGTNRENTGVIRLGLTVVVVFEF